MKPDAPILFFDSGVGGLSVLAQTRLQLPTASIVYAADDQSFRFIGTSAFSGTPGEINYYHLDGNTYIQLQTGMSPDVEGVIRFDGIVTPEASWFFL